MSARPKNQHWVPRFYLKHFASEESKETGNPQVWFIDKSKDASGSELISTKKLCGKRYLYTPESLDGDRDWSLEDYLSELESEAAAYWDSLAHGELDLSEDRLRAKVAEFIAALHLRNKLIFDLYKSVMKNRDALFGAPQPTPSEACGHVDEDRPDPTHPGRFFVHKIRSGIPRITKSFLSYQWTLLMCADRVLISSDAPVTFIDSLPRRSGPGASNPKAVFPVAPNAALHMAASDKGPGTSSQYVNADVFWDLNHVIAHQAERFVILGGLSESVLNQPSP